jgi:hypothetical protein
MTHSIAFSSLALFSAFYVYPATSDIRFLEKWLIGFYYNTPYPTLFGYLTLLIFMVCWIAITNNNTHRQGFNTSRLSKMISFGGIVVAYTPFVILPVIYIIISYLEKKGKYLLKSHSSRNAIFLNELRKGKKLRSIWSARTIIVLSSLSLLVIVIIVIANAYFGDEQGGSVHLLFERVQANAYFYSGIVLTTNFFGNFTGVSTFVAIAFALVFLIQKRRINLSVFYLLISTLIISSSIGGEFINNFLWPFFLGRLFAFLIVLNWIMIAIFVNDVIYSVCLRDGRKRSGKISKGLGLFDSSNNIKNPLLIPSVRTSIVLALIFIFFLPSLISNLSLEQAEHWNWIFGRDSFMNDYALFAWISRNVNTSDLIMTDSTFASRSLQSFSLKNVTASLFPDSSNEVERDKNNAIAWSRPTLLRSFIDRYDVKYVLLDSEPYHRVPPEVSGDNEYTQRAYDIAQYNEIFNHMPFLKVVKRVGDSTLYQVSSQIQIHGS